MCVVESLWEWLLEIVYMGLTKMGRLILILGITILWVGFLYWVKGGKISDQNHSLLSMLCECLCSVASCLNLLPQRLSLSKRTEPRNCEKKKYFLKFHLLNILSQQPTKYTFQNCQKILNSFTMKNNKWYLTGK